MKYTSKLCYPFLWCVILPLVIGVLIYAFRPVYPSAFLDLSILNTLLTPVTSPVTNFLMTSAIGKWSLYSMPAALWAFSLCSFIQLRTSSETRNIKILYIGIAIFLILSVEIQQLVRGVETFDLTDLLSMFIAAFLAFILVRRRCNR